MKTISLNKKIFDALFKGEVFEENGYKYRFDSIEKEKNSNYIKVTWIPEFLPHSYYLLKMVHDVTQIIDSKMKMFSSTYNGSDQVEIFVEDKPLKSKVYVRKKLLKDILKKLNEGPLELKKSKESNLLFIDCKFSFSSKPYMSQDDGIVFYLLARIDKVYDSDGKSLVPNPDEEIDDIAATLLEELYESEVFSVLEERIINLVEPEFKIGNYDVYYYANFEIATLFGKYVNTYKGYPLEDSKNIFI